MLHKKYHLVILVICGIFSTTGICYGQQSSINFDREQQKTITLTEFNRRVDRAAIILQTKSLSTIFDFDHVNIMMCLNTIKYVEVGYKFTPRFSGGRYKMLEKQPANRTIETIYLMFIPGIHGIEDLGIISLSLKWNWTECRQNMPCLMF